MYGSKNFPGLAACVERLDVGRNFVPALAAWPKQTLLLPYFEHFVKDKHHAFVRLKNGALSMRAISEVCG